MPRLVELGPRAERSDDDRDLPLGAGRDVFFEPDVGLVDDLVDRIGRGRAVRIVPIPRRQLFGNLVKPLIELRLWSGIERRKRPDDPRLALGDDQIGHRDDEQRRSDYRKREAIEERGKSHADWIA